MKLSKIYKAETYKKAQELCPKGYRIPKLWELFWIAENTTVLQEYEEGTFRCFWSSTLLGNGVHRLDRGRIGGWSAGWDDDLDSFSEGCRVVFVKGSVEK